MTELRLRNVSPDTMALLRDQAKANALSLDQWLTRRLDEIAMAPMLSMLAELKASRDEMRQTYGTLPDSTPGIRDEREAL